MTVIPVSYTHLGAVHGLLALRHDVQKLDSALTAGHGQGLGGEDSASGFAVAMILVYTPVAMVIGALG